MLSALHGLVRVGDVIDPYDTTLNTMAAADRRAWAARVNVQLRNAWSPDAVVFVVLAGAKYRAALSGLTYEVPMGGLGIGQQLAWLKRAASET